MKRITMSVLSGVVAMAAFACSHDHMSSSSYGSSTGGGPGMQSSGSYSSGGKWQNQGMNNGSSYGTTGTSSQAPIGGQGGGPSTLGTESSGSFENHTQGAGSSSNPDSSGGVIHKGP